jgi:hypothetical protein
LNSQLARSAASLVEKMQLDQKRIISFRNHFKEKWDFLVLLLAIQNSLIIPLDLAFHPAWASTSAY